MKPSGNKMETKAADAGIRSDDNKGPPPGFGSTNLKRAERTSDCARQPSPRGTVRKA